jgi:NACalpha-BTF3-like transcription factor
LFASDECEKQQQGKQPTHVRETTTCDNPPPSHETSPRSRCALTSRSPRSFSRRCPDRARCDFRGDHPFTYVEQGGQTYVSAEQVTAALGGTLTPDANGFKVAVGNNVAAFGPDSQYGVIRDDLIEMPVPPISIEGKPYVPWQFFQGMLAKTASLDVSWDASAHVLSARPAVRDAVGVQVSVANVQGISKIVLTLSGHAEYGILKEPDAYVVRFKGRCVRRFRNRLTKIRTSRGDVRRERSADSTDRAGRRRRCVSTRQSAAHRARSAQSRGTRSGTARAAAGTADAGGRSGHSHDRDRSRPRRKAVGAVGPGGLLEKDITLAISQKLATSLAKATGARVVLTREDDSLVSLDQRTAVANQYKADLFLSVHMNAAVVKDAQGSETYYLSLEASDELAKKAAETENASAGNDPASDLKLILWDLAQQAYIEESSASRRPFRRN